MIDDSNILEIIEPLNFWENLLLFLKFPGYTNEELIINSLYLQCLKDLSNFFIVFSNQTYFEKSKEKIINFLIYLISFNIDEVVFNSFGLLNKYLTLNYEIPINEIIINSIQYFSINGGKCLSIIFEFLNKISNINFLNENEFINNLINLLNPEMDYSINILRYFDYLEIYPIELNEFWYKIKNLIFNSFYLIKIETIKYLYQFITIEQTINLINDNFFEILLIILEKNDIFDESIRLLNKIILNLELLEINPINYNGFNDIIIFLKNNNENLFYLNLINRILEKFLNLNPF